MLANEARTLLVGVSCGLYAENIDDVLDRMQSMASTHPVERLVLAKSAFIEWTEWKKLHGCPAVL
jgi:hypothetical protein